MNLGQIIKDSSFLSHLYPTERADIISVSEKKIFPTGHTIYTEDAKGDFIYFIASGEVKVSSGNNYETKSSGECFGEEIYFGSDKYVTTATAIEDSEIYILPGNAFKSTAPNRETVSSGFFSSFVKILTKQKIVSIPSDRDLRQQETSYTEIFGWIFTLVSPLVVFFLLEKINIPSENKWFLSFLTCSISMWMFRLLPEFVPGLFLLMSTLMFGLAPIPVVLIGLSSETFLLIMSVFVISLLITSSGLTHRFAIFLMNFASRSVIGLNLAIFLIGTILTPMVPSIVSRCALVPPIVTKMLHSLKINEKSMLSVQFAASAFFGCSIFANVVLSSSLMNFVVLGLLPLQEQDQFQWLGWLKAASVYGITVAVGYFGFMFIAMLFTEKKKINTDRFAQQATALGKFRQEEITAILGILILTLGLLTNSYHKIHPALITLFVMFCILGFGFITKKQFQTEIDWPFLIFMAAAVSITSTIKYLGMDIWISDFLRIITANSNSATLFLTYTCIITLIVRIFIPIAPAVVILCTTFIPLAVNEGINPWLVCFMILVAADIWFAPYQNSFYLIFEEAGLINGKLFYDRNKFIIFNALVGIVKIGSFYVSIPYWKSIGLM